MAPLRKKRKLSNGGAASAEVSSDVADINTQNETSEAPRRSLFVRSLPPTTTTDSLTELFSESYPVKHATAVIDPVKKECRGYGFVTFADAEDALRAKDEFNGHVLEGRKLRIEIAEPRHRDVEAGDAPKESSFKQRQKQQDTPLPSRLIVRNLPWTIKTSDQLSKLFMSYGKVKQAYIPKKGPGLMAGFGFVVMRGRKNAERAMEGINGKEVDGRTLAVDWAVTKEVYEDILNKDSEKDTGDSENLLAKGLRADDENSEVESSNSKSDHNDTTAAQHLEDDEIYSDDDEHVEIQVNGEDGHDLDRSEDRSTTVFVRNLPFTCTDEDLEDHFASFGKTRYARVVMDVGTERSKGTGFVCFYDKADADLCLRGAPKRTIMPNVDDAKEVKSTQMANSILQNEEADPTGQYTIDGRVLQISRAVDKSEANRLTQESVAQRRKRNEDKRRLYLLSEGTISSKSKLWEKLSPSERTMRDASARQRKTLIESNPSLHLSLTRLSIRNIPRSIDSKELKALAREAVVGFATDVKAEERQKLSKEELARGGEEMQAAEQARKKSGKGVVKQAKVVFEGTGGSKVSEDSGAGRSRGYGFIEYYTHRSALMGLRWLNGHAVGYQVKDDKKNKASKEEMQDRKKRLIVEFAIENAQVVLRRKDREEKARDRSKAAVAQDGLQSGEPAEANARKRKRGPEQPSKSGSRKPKIVSDKSPKSKPNDAEKPRDQPKKTIGEKLAKRNQIIGRKRAVRKARKSSR